MQPLSILQVLAIAFKVLRFGFYATTWILLAWAQAVHPNAVLALVGLGVFVVLPIVRSMSVKQDSEQRGESSERKAERRDTHEYRVD